MLTVTLSAAKNPDHKNEPRMPRKHQIRAATLRMASEVCRAWIDANKLGGGNWTGGQVFNGKKQIARISYNGRVWDMNGQEVVSKQHKETTNV